jgi:dipeptidyl aminopeptidase/acylaminoacyl peptidase
LVKHSTLTTPAQVFLAADAAHPEQAKAISSFNPIFIERAQPEWKPYQWKADDGTTVEGVLIYPPDRMRAKRLRMLTLIHGGCHLRRCVSRGALPWENPQSITAKRPCSK